MGIVDAIVFVRGGQIRGNDVTTPRAGFHPAVSPNGTKIAFDDGTNLFTMDVNGVANPEIGHSQQRLSERRLLRRSGRGDKIGQRRSRFSHSHDHGTNAHYASWWRAGATSNRMADCNTFAAPSSDVS